MKNTELEIFVIKPEQQGFLVHSNHHRPRYYHSSTASRIVDDMRMADPSEIRVELSCNCLPLASVLYYSEFASRLRLHGRHVVGEIAHRYNRMVGGLRAVEPADKILFEVCAQLLFDQEVETIIDTMSRHPVWKYLTFPFGVCIDAVCSLVLKVVDPRSHIDPAQNSLTCEIGSLRKYLGVSCRRTGTSAVCAKTVAAAWGRFHGDDLRSDESNDFFRAMYSRLRVQGMTDEEAERRTSAKYVAYLQKAWLEAIRSSGSEKFFDAQLLFGKADVVKSLQAHLDGVDSVRTRD